MPSQNEIITGKRVRPIKILIYGVEKIGKSSFANTFPKPFFIQTDPRLDFINCARTPLLEHTNDILEWLVWLKGEHDYRTVVIDTLDATEQAIQRDIVKRYNAASINDFQNKTLAYAGGYKIELEQVQNILSVLNALVERRGLNVCLVAHSQIKKFEDPVTASYDRYQLDLYEKAANMFCEWVDCIGFMRYKAYTKEEQARFGVGKVKAEGGKRVVHWTARPSYIAGNSFNLPDEMPLTNPDGTHIGWSAVKEEIKKDMRNGKSTSAPGTPRKDARETNETEGSDKPSGNNGQPDSGESGRLGETDSGIHQESRGRKKEIRKPAKRESKGNQPVVQDTGK